MQGKSLFESSICRAWVDTISFQKSGKFFWVVEVVVINIFAAAGTTFTPEKASNFIAALYSAGGATVGAVVGFILIFVFFILAAPYKQRNEARRSSSELQDKLSELTSAKLIVNNADSYNDGKECNWIRLRVENPTAQPINECYGKLFDRKQVSLSLTNINGELIRPVISEEAGRRSLEHGKLPPEGHRFPWAPDMNPPITITIPGFNSIEFLYVAAKKTSVGYFGFPSESGINYANWGLGDFELGIEIGSQSEKFKPTKVNIIFRASGGDLEFIKLVACN